MLSMERSVSSILPINTKLRDLNEAVPPLRQGDNGVLLYSILKTEYFSLEFLHLHQDDVSVAHGDV